MPRANMASASPPDPVLPTAASSGLSLWVTASVAGFVCVLVDRLDGELEFKGETPQAAVQAAIDRLEVVSGSITH